ncbi:MAG: HAD family hydrolase [Lachnospiraceae bacterium]|nr:HAD family hydrolase [Lachnospiraceae bacterium]
MIKLIASDIDGTILPEGTDLVNPELYDVIRALKKKGIRFAAASGRQYESMHHVFAPVEEDIYFIAENGTNLMYRGKCLDYVPLDGRTAEEVIRFIRAQEGCRLIVSTPEIMYTEGYEEAFLDWLVNGYHNKVTVTEDAVTLCSRVNKISLYHPEKAALLAEEARKQFGDRLYVTLAGQPWIDFMPKGTDKGTALAQLQQRLGVSREETMAFGDNCNDISMICQAGESYAVANAHPQLKEAAKYMTGSYEEDGVLQVLRQLL